MANTVSSPIPPPSAEDTSAQQQQRRTDSNHLYALAIFHYLLAVFAAAIVTYTARGLMEIQQMIRETPSSHRQDHFFYGMVLPLIVVFALGCALNVASGWCMMRRKAWVFSLVVAGLDLLYFPIGTVLALCTFVVLLRGSVCEMYGRRSA